MNYSSSDHHTTRDIDNGHFKSDASQVPDHDVIQPLDHRILSGCVLVGIVGVVILLIVVAGASPGLAFTPVSG